MTTAKITNIKFATIAGWESIALVAAFHKKAEAEPFSSTITTSMFNISLLLS